MYQHQNWDLPFNLGTCETAIIRKSQSKLSCPNWFECDKSALAYDQSACECISYERNERCVWTSHLAHSQIVFAITVHVKGRHNQIRVTVNSNMHLSYSHTSSSINAFINQSVATVSDRFTMRSVQIECARNSNVLLLFVVDANQIDACSMHQLYTLLCNMRRSFEFIWIVYIRRRKYFNFDIEKNMI